MKWKTYIPCFKNLTYRWLLNMCTFSFLRWLKYSGNWKVLFVNVLVRKWSSTTICKIYDFEYVTYASKRFVAAWHIEIVFNSSRTKSFSVSEWETALSFGIVIFWLGGKIYMVKIEKWIVFPEWRYVNSNPACSEYF